MPETPKPLALDELLKPGNPMRDFVWRLGQKLRQADKGMESRLSASQTETQATTEDAPQLSFDDDDEVFMLLDDEEEDEDGPPSLHLEEGLGNESDWEATTDSVFEYIQEGAKEAWGKRQNNWPETVKSILRPIVKRYMTYVNHEWLITKLAKEVDDQWAHLEGAEAKKESIVEGNISLGRTKVLVALSPTSERWNEAMGTLHSDMRQAIAGAVKTNPDQLIQAIDKNQRTTAELGLSAETVYSYQLQQVLDANPVLKKIDTLLKKKLKTPERGRFWGRLLTK